MKKELSAIKDPTLLHEIVLILLESNLEDSKNEEYAKIVLKQTRKAGFRFSDPSRGCPECSACLHMALMNAASQLSNRLN